MNMVHSALPQLLHLLFVIHLNLSRAPFANAQAQASASDSSNSKLQSDSNSQCELLNTSLTYSQDNAPRDISGVLPLMVERVNRELSGVVDVEVLFTGSEIHRRVGKRTVRCSVTRLLSAVTGAGSSPTAGEQGEGHHEAELDVQVGYERSVDEYGRDVVTQCFLVPFTITDVDECKVPVGHAMRHRCEDPALCVNTEGSYECVCPAEEVSIDGKDSSRVAIPSTTVDDKFWEAMREEEEAHVRSPWELSIGSSLLSSCPSKSSTFQCCHDDAHENEGSSCRSKFRCPVDPCQSFDSNTCVASASCQRAANPLDRPLYSCVCPMGLMGNGHRCRKGIDVSPVPKVGFDEITPTDETKKNNMYCGCTKPIVDPCSGFPKCEGKNEVCTVTATNSPVCACKPGFVKVDKFGCVDESPPILKLRNDPNLDGITRLKQGDVYKEHAVDVIDENAEDYLRSLKIAYSRPLPPGCLAEIGSFHVNYTVAMPWANPPYARVTRNVIIDDIDECNLDVVRFETTCPQLIPQCDTAAGAVCENTNGSYTCKCPKYTSGDGFKFISSVQKVNDHFIGGPVGYKGGTGCKDTSKPVIELVGPNPKVIRTCKVGGLSGIMKATKKRSDHKNEKMQGDQMRGYEEDIATLIKVTAGAELCATHTRKNPKPSDCIKATDHTYRGDEDLSDRVTIGNLVQLSDLEWKVPYNVMDDAGNAADVVWRRITVEEVELNDIEEKIHAEILGDKDRAIKEAVEIAVEIEKKRQSNGKYDRQQQNDDSSSTCKTCPICDCKIRGGGLSAAECDSICEGKMNEILSSCQSTGEQRSTAGRTLMHSFLDYFIDLTEGILSPNFAGMLLISFTFVLVTFLIQRIISVNQGGWQYFDAQDEQRERDMLNQVTYYNGLGRNEFRSPTGNSVTGAQPPPRHSLSSSAGIFSPSQNEPGFRSPTDASSIYQNDRETFRSPMGPIMPNHRQAESRDRATPYNLRSRN